VYRIIGLSDIEMSHRTKDERALQDIYDEIPQIPDCTGYCVASCGPIFMFTGEWDRVQRSLGGSAPRMRPGSLICPMLSSTGRCKVYSVRPYICRLWGTTEALACPQGCQPERWLTSEEAHDIFERVQAITGPGTDGPMGSVADLWRGIGLDVREQREAVIAHIAHEEAREALEATLAEARKLLP
jgi:Fe-S-cluster containining protein